MDDLGVPPILGNLHIETPCVWSNNSDWDFTPTKVVDGNLDLKDTLL